uniref:Uncharacterized protein n=1 Tax=viral metagenome TaxID=1070528 RepID=A0A6C0EDJ1_9ZZZZ
MSENTGLGDKLADLEKEKTRLNKEICYIDKKIKEEKDNIINNKPTQIKDDIDAIEEDITKCQQEKITLNKEWRKTKNDIHQLDKTIKDYRELQYSSDVAAECYYIKLTVEELKKSRRELIKKVREIENDIINVNREIDNMEYTQNILKRVHDENFHESEIGEILDETAKRQKISDVFNIFT